MRHPLAAEVRGAGRRGPAHKSRDDERVQKFSADTPRAGALIPRGESESQNGATAVHQCFYLPMAAVQIIFFFPNVWLSGIKPHNGAKGVKWLAIGPEQAAVLAGL